MPQADTRSESAADPIAQALACPCIDDLKASACGGALVAAFTCFHRSTTVPKGCDCLPLHQAFAECLKLNPGVLEMLKAAATSDVGHRQQQQAPAS